MVTGGLLVASAASDSQSIRNIFEEFKVAKIVFVALGSLPYLRMENWSMYC